MAGQFAGKVALVTGGSSGFGRASSQAFAREGARVIVSDVNVDGGRETVRMIEEAGGEADFVKTDVSRAAEVEAMVNAAIRTYGRLDYAHNNAGIFGARGTITELTEEQWDRVIDTNLKSIFLCLKHELAYMAAHGGGAIVNTASIAGLRATGGPDAAYTTAKHGVVGLTRSAALGYANAGIRVNAVCPGPVETPLYVNQVHGGNAQNVQAAASKMILGRLATPEEVANAVVWLCSDAASYINAVGLPIDGGLEARWSA